MKYVDFGDKINKPLLITLVGLPGSGKSTTAKKMAELYKATVYSSDAYRAKILGDEGNQSEPEKVFNNLHNDIREALKKGENVIFDATNTRMKYRRIFLDSLKREKIDCFKVVCVFAEPIQKCLFQLHNREASGGRAVPEDVVKRMMANFQFPQPFEGWDVILILGNENTLPMFDYNTLCKIEDKMENFDQHNHHHSLTLGQHARQVESLVHERNLPYSVAIAARFHDVGKLYTATFDENGEAHYYNHANVSVYWLITHLRVLPPISMETLFEVLLYINYHMLPFQWKTEKVKEKWRGILGEKHFNLLMQLHECDKEGA